MNFSFFKLFSYTPGAFLICGSRRLEKTHFDIQVSTGSHLKRRKSLQSMYRASGAFETYAYVSCKLQDVSKVEKISQKLKILNRRIYFKGARGSVHTLKAFSTFQMASSTYLDIKMSFFESARFTNQKGAVGI